PPPLPSFAPRADPRSPPSSPIAMAFGWRRGHGTGDAMATPPRRLWWIRPASSGADRQAVVYPPVELLGVLASCLHAELAV
ncbi:hypothetical protein BDA96_10G168100, partial [Sorghum bicolor]